MSKPVDQDAVARVLAQLKECERIHERRYWTSDGSIEKIGELSRENPWGFLLHRDELSGFLRSFEKFGHDTDRDFYLEAWNGTGEFTFDRIGRGTVDISALCLSVLGGMQPGKLRAHISEALGEGAGADGLLQRFQVIVWPDRMRPYRQISGWPNKEAKARARDVAAKLDSLDPAALGAECDDFESPAHQVPYLRFDPEAQCLFDAWRLELETRLRSPELERTPAFCSHISKYRKLMPALALLFDLMERVAGMRSLAGGVGLRAAQLAAAWCDFLEAHARKIYSRELHPERSAAHLLVEKIKAGAIKHEDSVRDLYRPQWAGLKTPEVVWAGLRELEGLGWLRIVEGVSKGTGGRPPSDVIHLHPDLRRRGEGV